jgi:type IV pilus assembly protein PilE
MVNNKIKHLGQKLNKSNGSIPAFTLSELLVVLVIIGILVLLALPKFMPLISKTRSVEAKQALKFVHTLERSYFFEYARYSNDLKAIHFEQENLATDADGGSANYQIEIVEASASSFVARATAVVDFDGDGEFNVWEINELGDMTEVKND